MRDAVCHRHHPADDDDSQACIAGTRAHSQRVSEDIRNNQNVYSSDIPISIGLNCNCVVCN